MRSRFNKFSNIVFSEVNKYLTDNCVFGFTSEIKESTIVYSYNIMFRKNKEKPEMLFIEVSQKSKLPISAWTDKGIKFNNIYELKKYTYKSW